MQEEFYFENNTKLFADDCLIAAIFSAVLSFFIIPNIGLGNNRNFGTSYLGCDYIDFLIYKTYATNRIIMKFVLYFFQIMLIEKYVVNGTDIYERTFYS